MFKNSLLFFIFSKILERGGVTEQKAVSHFKLLNILRKKPFWNIKFKLESKLSENLENIIS